MGKLTALTICGYRSIRDEITLCFPERAPLVLVGENNAGKSNIVRALDLLLGEIWPGNREPEDHEFWERNSSNGPIRISAEVEGVTGTDYYGRTFEVRALKWKYEAQASGDKCTFRAVTKTGEERYVSNEIREQCTCIVIGADRRLSYQLSYASKWTLLAKLMRKFHGALTQDSERVNRLKQKFQEVKAIFEEVMEFGHFQSGLSDQFGEMFAGMSYGLQVDFSAYDPSNFFHSLRVVPQEGGSVRTFEELGTGQEQLLALAFAHAYAKAFYGGIVLVFEEPEAHLHPLAQEWLARKIHQMAADGLQVVVSTHSPAFLDVLGIEGVALVRKLDGATSICQLTPQQLVVYCTQRGADPARTTESRILPFYASHATQEILNGFFAKSIMLVEGMTEALTLPVFLQTVGLDVTKQGIAIIPVMGKGNLAKWWRLFTAYGIPTYVTFDNDTVEDKGACRRRDALGAIGIGNEEIENVIGGEEWVIRTSYCVFGKDFEAAMRTHFSKYSKLESEACDLLGDSKPLIARYVAERLNVGDDPGWEKYRELARTLVVKPTDGDTPRTEAMGQEAEQQIGLEDDWPSVPTL